MLLFQAITLVAIVILVTVAVFINGWLFIALFSDLYDRPPENDHHDR